jgi:hypothetical protein
MPGGGLFRHELPDAAVHVDDVLAALVRIVLERGDARVPVALGVVDDDEFDLLAGTSVRALVRAARRDPLGARVLGLVRQDVELLRDVDRERRRQVVGRKDDDLAIACLEAPAAREGGEDLVRVVLAVGFVREAAHLLDRRAPGGEVPAASVRLRTELGEDQRAGLEREVGMDAEIDLGDAGELGAAAEGIELAAPELERTGGRDLVVDVDVEALGGDLEAVLHLCDREEKIARHAGLRGARRERARHLAGARLGDGGVRARAAAGGKNTEGDDAGSGDTCTLQHHERSTLAATVPALASHQ